MEEITLDKEQKEIVYSNKPRILVISNAGAGKTRCLTERIKRLINDGEYPNGIVAITFTNAAADEMKQRLGDKCLNAFIGTIHSYINKILLQNGVDTSDLLEKENFDELFDMLLARPSIINNLKINHLLVDECQDLDEKQYILLKEQIPAKNKFFVGDDWQMIYGFRGSSYEYTRAMYEDPNYTVYYITNNYRSGRNIIIFASQFMRDVLDKTERPTRPQRREQGEVYSIYNMDEALADIDDPGSYKDWMILVRTNDQVEEVREKLARRKVATDTFKKSEITAEELSQRMAANTVKVLTAHSAKGLEAKNVIVYGLIPYNDDEKRLCYVACTRAADRLYWCKKQMKKQRKMKNPKRHFTQHDLSVFDWE